MYSPELLPLNFSFWSQIMVATAYIYLDVSFELKSIVENFNVDKREEDNIQKMMRHRPTKKRAELTELCKDIFSRHFEHLL